MKKESYRRAAQVQKVREASTGIVCRETCARNAIKCKHDPFSYDSGRQIDLAMIRLIC